VACQEQIVAIEKRLLAQHRKNADSKRLETIPGIGVIGASAFVATVPDASIFKTGRDFAAWIGIVSREDSTGGTQRLGPISKQGDRYLRRILIVGALAVLRQARAHPEKYPWLTQLLALVELLVGLTRMPPPQAQSRPLELDFYYCSPPISVSMEESWTLWRQSSSVGKKHI
jgi:transposase